MSWPEAEVAISEYPLMLLPVGAATKEHGPHLPLNCDWLQAEYLTRRLMERRPLLVLPTIAYGHYPAFVDYPGSVNLAPQVFRDTVIGICRSLAAHGARACYVLNTGISTIPPLQAARDALAEHGISLRFTDVEALMADVEERIGDQARGSHADELETSVMLYIAPDRVQMQRAVPELALRSGPGRFCREPAEGCGLLSPSGSWGDPTLATREKGKRYVEALITRLCDTIDAMQPR